MHVTSKSLYTFNSFGTLITLLSREKRRKYMKKGLWNEKELKLLLWSVVYFSEFISRKIDEFVTILVLLKI